MGFPCSLASNPARTCLPVVPAHMSRGPDECLAALSIANLPTDFLPSSAPVVDCLLLGFNTMERIIRFIPLKDSKVRYTPLTPHVIDSCEPYMSLTCNGIYLILRLDIRKIGSISEGADKSLKRNCLVCAGCAAGVTWFEVDLESKKVVVKGDVTPFEVLQSVSKVKVAQLWIAGGPQRS